MINSLLSRSLNGGNLSSRACLAIHNGLSYDEGQSQATKKKVGCEVIEKRRKKMSRRLEIQINYSLKQQTKSSRRDKIQTKAENRRKTDKPLFREKRSDKLLVGNIRKFNFTNQSTETKVGRKSARNIFF